MHLRLGRTRRPPREGILRRRILILTVLPLGLLIGLALVLVQQRVLQHIEDRVGSELRSALAVWDEMVQDRQDEIRQRGWIIARDPKFFALLTIPPEERRAEFGPSLELIVQEFRRAIEVDLFEVYDEYGRGVAGIAGAAEPADVRAALEGTSASAIEVRGDHAFQIESVPIVAGGAIVGVLRLGLALDREFGLGLKNLTGCDLTLVSPERPQPPMLQTMTTPPARSLSVTASLPSSPLVAELSKDLSPDLRFVADLRRSLMEVAFLILLLTVGTGVWLARSITDPVKQILDAARRMEKGVYDSQIQVRTGDELEHLAHRFTEMRRVIREQIHELKDLDQMKSDFLTLASHELRTPLTGLVAYADLLSSGAFGEIPEGQEQAIGQIQECSLNLSRVIEQITDMTLLDRRHLALNRRSHSVADLLAAAGSRRQADFHARGLRFEVAPPGEPGATESVHVEVDGEKILQVLDNLLHNAIRFTPSGGAVSLAAEVRRGVVTFQVSDTGIGIAPEGMRHLFEPFYGGRDLRHHRSGTIEFNTGGMGLGLAIARAIVRGHGGDLTVESRIQEGSTFRFTLPLAEEAELSREAA